MKRLVFVFFLVALQLGSIIQPALAQAPPPSGGSTVGAPIDDHAWLLALSALLTGVYFLYQKYPLPAFKGVKV